MPRKTNEEIVSSDRYNMKLPDRLRDLFRKTNYTQDQLAEKLGVKRQSISYYCDGSSKPDWEKLGIIAKFFGVSSDYLIGITDDPKPKSSVIDDLGLPISVCDMLLEHNKAESCSEEALRHYARQEPSLICAKKSASSVNLQSHTSQNSRRNQTRKTTDAFLAERTSRRKKSVTRLRQED